MRALVLSGGATKGAYQVGVLKKWIGEQGCDYDIMCGVSVGAINVAALAQSPLGDPRPGIVELERFWRSINQSSIIAKWKYLGRLLSIRKASAYDASPLIKLLNDNINVSAIKMSGRKLRVGAVCLDTGEFKYGREDFDDLIKWIQASSSYPFFMQPVEIDGKLWCDGGLRHMTPLREAIRLGANEVDVIMCSNPSASNPWNPEGKAAVPDYVFRIIDLMTDQILRSDLQLVGLMNDVVMKADKVKHVKIRLVQPDKRLTSNSMQFDPKEIAEMIDVGYRDADNATLFE